MKKVQIYLFILIGLLSELASSTEIRPIILYRSLWTTPFSDALSPEEHINAYNLFYGNRYSTCINKISALPKGSSGACYNTQITGNTPVTGHVIGGVPSEYRQDTIYTISNKDPVTGTINTTTQNITTKIFSTVWACPPDSYSIGPISDLRCVLQESVQNQCNVIGNPINYLTGDKYQREVDFSSETLSLERIYRNQRQGWSFEAQSRLIDRTDRFTIEQGAIQSQCDGYSTLYKLWRHISPMDPLSDTTQISYQLCLRYVKSYDNRNSIILVNEDGFHKDFYWNGSWYLSSVSNDRLLPLDEAVNDGYAWVLHYTNGKSEYFDRYGLLRKKTDSNRRTTFYSYQQGVLKEQFSFSGQKLIYEYDSLKRLVKVILPNGKSINYQYESISSSNISRLNSVSYPDLQQKQYLYENPNLPLALTGINDEKGIRFSSWEYDIQGRAISSKHADNTGKWMLNFNTGPNRVEITNPLNKQTIYHFGNIAGARRVTRVEGQPTDNCAGANQEYTYTPEGWIASKTDWKGIKTTYSYNALGQEISRTEAVGTPEARTVITQWHPTLYLKTKIIEPDVETTYSYDESGRLLNKTVTSLSSQP